MFDEIMERQKLVDLDLTEDVVEMIIKKKKSSFEQKQRIIDIIPDPECSAYPKDEPVVVDEPTFYPPIAVPELIEPEPVKGFVDIVNIVIEQKQQEQQPIRRKLPWQRK